MDQEVDQQVPAPESAEVVTEQQEIPASEAPASESAVESEQQKVSDAAKVMAEQRRRNRENAERRIAQERDDYKRMAFEAIQALKQGRPAEPVQQAADEEPKREQFADYEEYVVAKAEWRAEKRALDKLNQQIAEAVQNHQKQATETQRRQVEQAHFQRVAQYAKQNPEFAELADRDDIRIPDAAADAIAGLEDGPMILHLIARDPSIAEGMHRLAPNAQRAYVGRLSGWLAAQSRQISNAAPAGRTVATKPAASDSPPDDPDAYMAWADKKFGKR